MFPLEWYNYAEIGALLVCLFLWPRLRKTDFWMLMPYLAFIVCLELTTRYMGRELKMTIGWIYNFTIPIEILFYAYLFRRQFESLQLRQVTHYFMFSLVIFAIVYNLVIVQDRFDPIFLKISTFSMIVLSCLYFIDILRREVPVNVLRQPMFWIAVGLIIFNAGELTMSLFLSELFEDRDAWRRIYKIVNNNLNVFLYLMLSVGAIVAVWKKKPA